MSDGDLTLLLSAAKSGDESAQAELYDHIYDELRRLARSRLRLECEGHTLQPTDLVSEAYLRLIKSKSEWQNRAHFFGSAAEAMRRVLIEHARKRHAQKRGGNPIRVTLSGIAELADEPDLDLLQLDDALSALAEADPRLSRIVELRYFAGLSMKETAEVVGRSVATVKRDWTYARAWLLERMSG